MTFEVERPEPGGPPQDRDADGHARRHARPGPSRSCPNEPLDVPGLGLAYPVRTQVVAVAPGSPAAKAGLKPGDVINAMTFPPPQAGEGRRRPSRRSPSPSRLEFDDESPAWASAF